jgi:hypothetical protein
LELSTFFSILPISFAMALKNIFKRSSPQQMRAAQQNVKQALLKLETCPIDDEVKKILWDRYQE